MTYPTPTTTISRMWNWKITAMAVALLLGVGLLGVSFGPIHLHFDQIVKTLVGAPGGLKGQDRTLLLDLRLPRVILAALVGGALATSGAVYQTVFRNPLADPYLLGVAAGAGLGATLAFTTTGGNVYGLLPIFSFVGGILAVLTSFFISGKFFAEPNTLLLLDPLLRQSKPISNNAIAMRSARCIRGSWENSLPPIGELSVGHPSTYFPLLQY